MGHIWGFLGLIIGPHAGSIAWPHHFPYRKTGFRGFLLTKFSERGAKFLSFSGALVQKQAFQKRDGSHPLFQCFVLVVGGWYC